MVDLFSLVTVRGCCIITEYEICKLLINARLGWRLVFDNEIADTS